VILLWIVLGSLTFLSSVAEEVVVTPTGVAALVDI